MSTDNQNVINTETREGDRWLSKREVCKRVGLSAESVRTRELAGKFVRRFYLSPTCARWSEIELNAWMAEKMKNCRRDDIAQAA